MIQNQIDILTVERDDAMAMAALQQETAETSQGKYTDGQWQGTAEGFGGEVAVEITVEKGMIEDIRILKAEFEDAAYLDMAKEMIPRMIQAQDFDVDTVSGATMTSTGIKKAAAAALKAGE